MDPRTVILAGGCALVAWGALRIARGRRDWSRDRLVHEVIGIALVGSIVVGVALQARWAFALTLVLAIASLVHRRRMQRS